MVAESSENDPVVGELAPITVPSILPPFRSTVAAVKAPLKSKLSIFNVAAVKLPVTVADEIITSVFVAVRLEVTLKLEAVTSVKRAVEELLTQIVTESKVPPFISAVFATNEFVVA